MSAIDSNVVEGLDDLFAKMDGLSLVLQRKLIVEALREGGDVIAREASARAPEGATHRLSQNEIVSVVSQTADGAIARIGPARIVFYGLFLEKGTIHMDPEPFLDPAYEATRDRAIVTIGEVLANGIELAWI